MSEGSEKIRVLRKRPGEAPEMISIDNSMEAFRAEVGGEVVFVTPLSDVRIVKKMCSRVDELPRNVVWCGVDLRGVILVVGCNLRKGTYHDLPVPEFWADSLIRQEVRESEGPNT